MGASLCLGAWSPLSQSRCVFAASRGASTVPREGHLPKMTQMSWHLWWLLFLFSSLAPLSSGLRWPTADLNLLLKSHRHPTWDTQNGTQLPLPSPICDLCACLPILSHANGTTSSYLLERKNPGVILESLFLLPHPTKELIPSVYPESGHSFYQA